MDVLYVNRINAGTKLNITSYDIDLQGRIKFKPTTAAVFPSCNQDRYGTVMFSKDDLGGGANRLYVCDSTGWNALD